MSVYRDATYSTETQEKLRALLAWLEEDGARVDEWTWALREVVAKWDANEATETTFE